MTYKNFGLSRQWDSAYAYAIHIHIDICICIYIYIKVPIKYKVSMFTFPPLECFLNVKKVRLAKF